MSLVRTAPIEPVRLGNVPLSVAGMQQAPACWGRVAPRCRAAAQTGCPPGATSSQPACKCNPAPPPLPPSLHLGPSHKHFGVEAR